MGRLRISAISYLNTAPLMWDFEHGTVGKEFEIDYTLPSSCARALKEGRADIGIIPSAAYATIPDLVILPGVAIAAQRAVRSILLVSKVPLERIRTVALDTSSVTSAVLTKVIFAKWLGGVQAYTPMAPDIGSMLRKHDAGLLIGDPALQLDRSRYCTYDLAEEWIRLTGQPFVFAFWAVRKPALKHAAAGTDLAAVFQKSRDHGLEPGSLDNIARTWGPQLQLPEAEVRNYLTENIYYQLDSRGLEGLQLFYRYAAETAALPEAPAMRFYEVPSAVAK